MRKHDKHCEGCRRDEGARFRTLANLYLCGRCYDVWLDTSEVPGADVGGTDEPELTETRRW